MALLVEHVLSMQPFVDVGIFTYALLRLDDAYGFCYIFATLMRF